MYIVVTPLHVFAEVFHLVQDSLFFLYGLRLRQIPAVFFLYIEANSVFDSFSGEPSRLFDVLFMGYVEFCGRTTFKVFYYLFKSYYCYFIIFLLLLLLLFYYLFKSYLKN